MNNWQHIIDRQADRQSRKFCICKRLKGFFSNNVLFTSFLIACLVALITCIISGFRFTYYTNDEYMMSLLIINGEKYSVFLNYFLVCCISFFQSSFPFVNCFALIQYILCFFAIIIINFVLLKIGRWIISCIVSAFLTLILFFTSILMFQWTHTTVVVFISGLVLITYSAFFETKRVFIFCQMIIGLIEVIISSGFRFDSFKVCVLFSFLFVSYIVFNIILRFKREHKSFSIKLICWKRVKRTICFVLAVFFSILASFCLNIISSNICSAQPSYLEHYEYSYARANVSDYEIVPYQGNESFYKGINISKNDLEFWKSYTIDKDYFNKGQLIEVENYTDKTLYGKSHLRFAIKKNIELVKSSVKQYYRELIKIKNALHFPVSNKAFLVISLCFLLIIAIFLVVLIHKINKGKKHDKVYMLLFSLLITIWSVFFLIVRIDDSNFLFVIVFALVTVNLLINRLNNYWGLVLFSICTIFLYLYQRCFRMFFRVSYTFIIPTIVFLIIFLFCNAKFNKSERNSFVRSIIAVCFICASILFSCSFFWYQHYIPSTKTYDSTLKVYINDHPESEYVSIWIGSLVDPAYTSAVMSPTTLKNNIDFASWYKSSDYYDTLIQDKFSKPVLEEAINSKSIRLIIKNRSDSCILEQFYREHYSSYGEINIIQEDEITISGKLNDDTRLNSTAYVLKVQS